MTYERTLYLYFIFLQFSTKVECRQNIYFYKMQTTTTEMDIQYVGMDMEFVFYKTLQLFK